LQSNFSTLLIRIDTKSSIKSIQIEIRQKTVRHCPGTRILETSKSAAKTSIEAGQLPMSSLVRRHWVMFILPIGEEMASAFGR
jgi:hypothetical protein